MNGERGLSMSEAPLCFGSRPFDCDQSVVSVHCGETSIRTCTMAGSEVGGVGAGIGNLPNMVAEPGAQFPIGQNGGGMNNGGQQVPIPVGGTPEMMRGRRTRVESRSR